MMFRNFSEPRAITKLDQLINMVEDDRCLKNELVYVYLARQRLTEIQVNLIASMLKHHGCPPNVRLRLSECELQAGAAVKLANALQDCLCERLELFLEANNIGPVGAEAFAKAFGKKLPPYFYINLHQNSIGEAGGLNIGDALIQMSPQPEAKVMEIALGCNDIRESGTEMLREAIWNNTFVNLCFYSESDKKFYSSKDPKPTVEEPPTPGLSPIDVMNANFTF